MAGGCCVEQPGSGCLRSRTRGHQHQGCTGWQRRALSALRFHFESGHNKSSYTGTRMHVLGCSLWYGQRLEITWSSTNRRRFKLTMDLWHYWNNMRCFSAFTKTSFWKKWSKHVIGTVDEMGAGTAYIRWPITHFLIAFILSVLLVTFEFAPP